MELHLDLASAPGRSLRARVEHALREAVRSGRLAPGTRLPSTRALCAELRVSRGVVVDAYAQLSAEGYLHTRRGGGTTVAATLTRERPPRSGTVPRPAARHDMSPFRPALSGFPRTAWSAAYTRVLRSAPDERLAYPDPAGAPELRATLAAYLGRVRGVRADPEQIVVTNGLRQGIELLWSTLAAAGLQRVAVEDPGWRGIRETATAAGLELVPLPVDDDGLIVERLEQQDVDAVAVAPAHQYPTGAVLSPTRRAALAAWAQKRDALIVEDDYDAEYRYDRQPIGSLQGLEPRRVVYGGSASKTLAPAVRLGWLALPERLVEPIAALQRLRGGMPTPLEQLALADLIERGELDRHLRRQRRRYQRQREALLAALASQLPEVSVHGAAAGLYAVLHLPEGLSEQTVLAAARSRGIALEGLAAGAPAIVVGYANLTDAAVQPAVAALAASIAHATTEAARSRSGSARRLRTGGASAPGRARAGGAIACFPMMTSWTEAPQLDPTNPTLGDSQMSPTNHQVRLAARPTGLPQASNWNITEEPVPTPGAGEFVVAISHLSLDPAMRGWMNAGASYIDPVEIGDVMRAGAVGRVIASEHPGFAVGEHVYSGFGVQEYALSDGAGAMKVDPSLAPLPTYLGTLGMTGMTAYFGLLDVGKVSEGDTVVVSGAAGAVGSAAGQIAKIKSAHVIGIAGGEEKCRWIVEDLGFDAAIDYRTQDVRAALRETAPKGVDVYFDNVGGEILDAVLTRLARSARIVICGAVSQYNSTDGMRGPANYMALLVARASMTGMVVFDYAARYGQAAAEIAGWMREGRLVSREDVVEGGVSAFPDTLLKLFSGENIGKLVLHVGSD